MQWVRIGERMVNLEAVAFIDLHAKGIDYSKPAPPQTGDVVTPRNPELCVRIHFFGNGERDMDVFGQDAASIRFYADHGASWLGQVQSVSCGR